MPARGRSPLAAACALLALLALPSAASAARPAEPAISVPPELLPYIPPVGPDRALGIADRSPQVRAERRQHPNLLPRITIYRDTRNWAISYFAGEEKVVDMTIDGRTGKILEAWRGVKAGWPMARGREGYFGEVFESWYVWIPLCVLFAFPFFDPRRPFRVLHLDLLVLVAGFGASHLFFNRGEIGTSVPLVYPVLAYMLARLAIAGFKPRQRTGRLVPVVPAAFLVAGIVLLAGVRIGLDVTSSHLGDVAWGSSIGAHRIDHGLPLYRDSGVGDVHADTYGPVNYLAYYPFVKVFPPSEAQASAQDDYSLPSAQAAAIFFDLMTAVGLFILGTRLRRGAAGRLLGLALTYAWMSFPYTLYALMSNTNDLLISMLLVYSLIAISSARVRGAILGLATAAKFAPLALAPLFATGRGGRRAPAWTFFGIAFVVVSASLTLPFIPRDGGFETFWSQTIGFQLSRESPFSIWGQNPDLAPLLTVVKVVAAGFALALAFVPRHRSAVQVAALGAAVLIATQLTAMHWFYFYIVWFTPFALVALFCEHSTARRRDPGQPADVEPPKPLERERQRELAGAH